ncbi:MAG: oxidative damage protection protein [Deltaproteobacteria bacterium]|nr:oxidative damage protection protein [Deltaproteobacteria bacterium]
MSERVVICSRYGKELPGLESVPIEGELGREIFEKVSKEAWDEWNDHIMIRVINEYRLDLIEDEQFDVLMDQMKAFFNL